MCLASHRFHQQHATSVWLLCHHKGPWTAKTPVLLVLHKVPAELRPQKAKLPLIWLREHQAGGCLQCCGAYWDPQCCHLWQTNQVANGKIQWGAKHCALWGREEPLPAIVVLSQLPGSISSAGTSGNKSWEMRTPSTHTQPFISYLEARAMRLKTTRDWCWQSTRMTQCKVLRGHPVLLSQAGNEKRKCIKPPTDFLLSPWWAMTCADLF